MHTEYEELFLAESQEHIAAINQLLLDMERALDLGAEPPAPDGEAVSGIFRAVHTIKGMSATMGYAAAAELSHEFETVLDAVRGGRREIDGDLIELAFAVADVLERAIAEAVQGRDGAIDTGWAVEKLRDCVAQALEPPRFPTLPIPAGDGLLARVSLAADAPLRGVRAFIVAAAVQSTFGKIECSPPIDELQFEQFDHSFLIRLCTAGDAAELEPVIRGCGDVIAFAVGEDALHPTGRRSSRAIRRDSVAVEQLDAPVPAPKRDTPAGGRRHVRMDLRRLDALMNLVGELVIARGRLQQLSAQSGNKDLEANVRDTSRLILELRDQITASRLVPAGQVFDRFPRLVRDLSRTLGKEVELTIEGGDIELDRSMLDEVADSLVHLLRNAIDHGIETSVDRVAAGKPPAGRLRLSAARERSAAVIRVADDGKGIDRTRVLAKAREAGLVEPSATELNDEDLFRILARPGFSTAATVTDISGRGVGFDAVHTRVRGLGGAMDVRSVSGAGTTVSLRLPLTLAVVRAVLVRVADETYAIPSAHVSETVELPDDAVCVVQGRDMLRLRGQLVPLVRFGRLVGAEHVEPTTTSGAELGIIVDLGDRRLGVAVDDLIGQEEIVVKPFDAVRGALGCFSGATLLASGAPALIVDVSSLN